MHQIAPVLERSLKRNSFTTGIPNQSLCCILLLWKPARPQAAKPCTLVCAEKSLLANQVLKTPLKSFQCVSVILVEGLRGSAAVRMGTVGGAPRSVDLLGLFGLESVLHVCAVCDVHLVGNLSPGRLLKNPTGTSHRRRKQEVFPKKPSKPWLGVSLSFRCRHPARLRWCPSYWPQGVS